MCRLGSSHKSWDTRPVHRAFMELLITWERGTSWECAKMVPTYLHILRAGLGFMGRMSQCFSVDFFLIYPVCKSHAASFWIFFTGNCSICNCGFGVFVGREAFRSLLCYLSSLTGTPSSHFFVKCISTFLKKHRVALKYIHNHV